MPAHRRANTCRGCQVPLTDDTWSAGYQRANNKQCIACTRAYQNRYYRKNREKRLEEVKQCQQDRRARLLVAYGGIWVCCGESDGRFLTIDHIFNDGSAHRRAEGLRGGARFYQWLERHGFPRDRFQLLCFNCNHGKHIYGACPHQLTHE